jgi:hypothetical protein
MSAICVMLGHLNKLSHKEESSLNDSIQIHHDVCKGLFLNIII